MNEIDLSSMTDQQLLELTDAIQTAIIQRAQNAATNKQAAVAALKVAVEQLDELIGDGTTAPGTDNYVGVQLFSDQIIGKSLVTAIRLILQGAELQARITRNVVQAISQ